MTTFDRPLYGFRFVSTRRGDTLQAIAARELGDAARWTDLIAYNSLVPPFITDDPAQATAGVILTGASILVPAPSPVVTSTTDPEAVFETDIALQGGRLTIANGDFGVVSGPANLAQALTNRIETEQGELIYHASYGSRVRRLVGAMNGPTASLLAAQYVRAAVIQDPRISKVVSATAQVSGDVIRAAATVQPVSGRQLQITASP